MNDTLQVALGRIMELAQIGAKLSEDRDLNDLQALFGSIFHQTGDVVERL
jgi:hypothetical protein